MNILNTILVKDLPDEEWKEIDHFPLYRVSNQQRIKKVAYERFCHKDKSLRFHPEQIIKQQKSKDGYPVVTLTGDKRKTKKVHRLEAIAFIPNPENLPIVHHKNEKKDDNRLENLGWVDDKTNSNEGTRNERISQKQTKRQFTDQHKANLSKAMRGNKNGAGQKHTAKQKEAREQAHNKAVYCDGITFKNIVSAAEYYKVNYRTFSHWLKGDRAMPDRFKKLGLRYA